MHKQEITYHLSPDRLLDQPIIKVGIFEVRQENSQQFMQHCQEVHHINHFVLYLPTTCVVAIICNFSNVILGFRVELQ